MSVTVFVTRPRYVVFASLTIVPEFFVDMSSECGMPHWGIFPPHCFLAVWRSEPPFIHGLRHSESHPRFRRSESLSLLSFDVQSHHHHFSVSAFRAVIDFQIDIQSHILEPSSIFRLTFRAASSFSAFRVVITSQFDVQSHHHHFSVSAIRAIIDFQIDIQSHILDRHSESHPRFRRSESLSLLSLTFRVIIITSQFRRSELSSVFRSTFRVASSVSAFRVVITSQFDSRCFLVWCLESALSSRITTPGVHIHWLCASCLHCFALSLGFSSLRYPVFIVYSSRSPHRVVPFGRILARTPGWFDRYSSLTLIS
ncbi:hypothetical protein CK203_052035 [Vitis vinifera]|uniref:Uncharacterized protein n=1 Tax=Vitis vinifera TaxID=29760 RepID=A0A438GR35_VITVI|nr:hypothetical protein CK203_052035 [Vitis vinifera]